MFSLPYVQPVFRPPSEANALILQVTIGCSHNKCTFCDMYQQPQQKFRVQPPEEIERQIRLVAQSKPQVDSVFLGDGDAMVLSINRLEQILDLIRLHLPGVSRVSSYCSPRNLENKSVAELARLRQKGLDMLYIGTETGDDELLQMIEKDECCSNNLKQISKLKEAVLRTAVVMINGLGGRHYSDQHATNSAKLFNAIQPDQLWMLVLTLPYGEERFAKNFNGKFSPLNKTELLEEMAVFIRQLELTDTFFNSIHASNYLPLHGTLGADKEKILQVIHSAVSGKQQLRPEAFRGL